MFVNTDNYLSMQKLENVLEIINAMELKFGSAIIYEEETGNLITEISHDENISEKFKHFALLCEKSIPDYYVTYAKINKYNNIIFYVKG